MKFKQYKSLFILFLSVGFFIVSSPAFSQGPASVENRVRALENYVDTFQPTLLEFSNGFEKSITLYTNQLEKNLRDFSKNLESKMDMRLDRMESRKALIDISSNAYQQVSTASGKFIISIKHVMPIPGGVRVTIDVGNPNFADYRDFKLKLFWGGNFDTSSQESYLRWREGLVGAEFTFQGRLERGTWNQVQVDLSPTTQADFKYLEVEMDVSSIELLQPKTTSSL